MVSEIFSIASINIVEILNKVVLMGSVVADSVDGITYFNESNFTFITRTLYENATLYAMDIGGAIAVNVVIPFMILFIAFEVFWEFADYVIGKDVIQMRLDFKQVFFILLLIPTMLDYSYFARIVDNLTNKVINQMTDYVVDGEDNYKTSMALSTYVMNVVSVGNAIPLQELAKEYKAGKIAPDQFYSAIQTKMDAKEDLRPVDKNGKVIEEEGSWIDTGLDYIETWSVVSMPTIGVGGSASVHGAVKATRDTKDTLEYLSNMSGESMVIAVVNFICSGIQWVVRSVIELIAFLFSLLLMALFPLSVLAYAIPGGVGKSSIADSMSAFLQFKLWIVLVAILDMLYSQIFTQFFIERVSNTLTSAENPPYEYLMLGLLGLVFTSLFIAVPSFANIIIKHGKATGAGELASAGASSAETTGNMVSYPATKVISLNNERKTNEFEKEFVRSQLGIGRINNGKKDNSQESKNRPNRNRPDRNKIINRITGRDKNKKGRNTEPNEFKLSSSVSKPDFSPKKAVSFSPEAINHFTKDEKQTPSRENNYSKEQLAVLNKLGKKQFGRNWRTVKNGDSGKDALNKNVNYIEKLQNRKSSTSKIRSSTERNKEHLGSIMNKIKNRKRNINK